MVLEAQKVLEAQNPRGAHASMMSVPPARASGGKGVIRRPRGRGLRY